MKILTQLPIIALCIVALLILAGCQTQYSTGVNATNSTDGKVYVRINENGSVCKVVNFMCMRGQRAFVDDKGCGCMPDTSDSQVQENTTTDTGVQYVSTDLEQCKVIRYLCVRGKEPFTDDKGCGCKPQSSSSDDTLSQISCDSARSAPVTNETNPVCGWFSQNVQCLRYPCAINAQNPSQACHTQNVEYYTAGACPTGLPSQTSSQKMEPKDPTLMCYELYQPVCATFDDGVSKTISNVCFANNTKGVVSTTAGECTTPSSAPAAKRMVIACPSSYTQQQNKSDAVCTMEYSPVCANDASGASKTYGNVCQACTTAGVSSYVSGECNANTGMMK